MGVANSHRTRFYSSNFLVLVQVRGVALFDGKVLKIHKHTKKVTLSIPHPHSSLTAKLSQLLSLLQHQKPHPHKPGCRSTIITMVTCTRIAGLSSSSVSLGSQHSAGRPQVAWTRCSEIQLQTWRAVSSYGVEEPCLHCYTCTPMFSFHSIITCNW